MLMVGYIWYVVDVVLDLSDVSKGDIRRYEYSQLELLPNAQIQKEKNEKEEEVSSVDVVNFVMCVN